MLRTEFDNDNGWEPVSLFWVIVLRQYLTTKLYSEYDYKAILLYN